MGVIWEGFKSLWKLRKSAAADGMAVIPGAPLRT
jgi:hypothetical protein